MASGRDSSGSFCVAIHASKAASGLCAAPSQRGLHQAFLMSFAAVREPAHACFGLGAPGPIRKRPVSAEFPPVPPGLLASPSPCGPSSAGTLELRLEFSPAISARSSSPTDWERYVSPASLRVRKNPPTKNSVSALSPFWLTKYHRRPLKPVGRCVRPMTCMLVAE